MGGFKFMFSTFSDLRTSLTASELAGEFIRGKIRETVNDPELAQKLLPLDHPFGSKRILIDTDYFETYNRDNVELVDINAEPIVEITETGITAGDTHHDVDVIVYATGFDAMTGSFNRIDIRREHVNEVAEPTMFMHANSWYLGANIPGKPRVFMPYAGGVGAYRQHCDKVVANGYEGFTLGARCDDGRCRLRP